MKIVRCTEDCLELSMNQILARIKDFLIGGVGGISSLVQLTWLFDVSSSPNANLLIFLELLVLAICLAITFVYLRKGLTGNFRMTCKFDRRSNQLVLHRYPLFGEQTIVRPLHAVVQVEVKEGSTRWYRPLMGDEIETYEIYLILKSGKQQFLVSADMKSRESFDQAAEAIQEFLRLSPS